MERILLIRLKSMGDVVFTLPAVNAVRAQFPTAKITFLTSRENTAVLSGFRALDEVLALDRGSYPNGNPLRILTGISSLLLALRREPFSLAFDFQGYGETEFLSWWSGAAERWGIVYKSTRGWCYTGTSSRRPGVHPAEWNLDLLRAAGINPGPVNNEFCLRESDLAAARQEFAAMGLDPARRTLFLQPFTSNPEKNWPLGNFMALADYWRRAGWQVVFGGGPADRAALEPARAAGFAVAAGAPLAVTAGLAALATFVVGADTGLMHLAVAMQKRVLMLMRSNGPGHCVPFQHAEWTVVPRTGMRMDTIELRQVIAAMEARLMSELTTLWR